MLDLAAVSGGTLLLNPLEAVITCSCYCGAAASAAGVIAADAVVAVVAAVPFLSSTKNPKT
jgi:hypothetical protein